MDEEGRRHHNHELFISRHLIMHESFDVSYVTDSFSIILIETSDLTVLTHSI